MFVTLIIFTLMALTNKYIEAPIDLENQDAEKEGKDNPAYEKTKANGTATISPTDKAKETGVTEMDGHVNSEFTAF